MMYCNRMFDRVYLDSHDGGVYLCAWMDRRGNVGNLLEQEFDEIWHGEKAEKLRELFRSGTHDFCRDWACPYLQNHELPDLDYDQNDKRWMTRETPAEIGLGFDYVCNQACPTCRNDYFKMDPDYERRMNIIIERILPYCNKAKILTGSGHGDTFASPYLMKLLSQLQPENDDITILMETNGVYFDEEHWKKVEHLSKYNLQITVTTNSYYEPVYNEISRGGNLKKLIENQYLIKSLRKEGKLKHATNSMVIQDKNFREIPSFIERSLNEFEFDLVSLKPVYNWYNMSEEEYWFKDVLNPLHPYHKAYMEIINMPIVRDNPRVYNFGGDTEHEPQPMPGTGGEENKKNRAYAELFRMWLNTDNIGEKAAAYLRGQNATTYAIYGAADVGKAFAKACRDIPYRLLGFVDQFVQCEEIDGTKIYRIDDVAKEADVVFVTPIHVFEQISKELKEAGYKGAIISVDQILGKYNG